MPARRSVSGIAPEWASLNLPYPVGYASCIIVMDHTGSWRRGDALRIAWKRRSPYVRESIIPDHQKSQLRNRNPPHAFRRSKRL